MKRLVILNPASRQGKAGREFARRRSYWENRLGPLEVRPTRYAGDATGIVRTILREGGCDQILAAGGDGTVNEVFSGYWEGGRVTCATVPLGIINLGTGGDFHRTVRALSPAYEDALAANRFRLVDAATVTFEPGGAPRPFLNVASAGMSAAMLRNLKSSRFQHGAAAYFWHTVGTLLRHRPVRVTVDFLGADGAPGRIEAELLNLFLCNGSCSGGGMVWAPGARLDDGLLRLTLISGTRKWPLVRHAAKVYRGRVGELPGAVLRVVREATLRSGEAVGFEVDGEILVPPEGSGVVARFEAKPSVFPLVL